MKILVTGAAGFIGCSVVQALSRKGNEVVGLDNINDYYDTTLKYARLENCGIKKDSIAWYKFIQSEKYPHYRFIRMHIEDKQAMQMLFANENFDVVCHLAAQAGVRYSIENPEAYIHSNIEGFLHIIEGCRNNAIKHLVYASSSSVYGLNGNVPFSEKAGIAHPTSLYAATKKANEEYEKFRIKQDEQYISSMDEMYQRYLTQASVNYLTALLLSMQGSGRTA